MTSVICDAIGLNHFLTSCHLSFNENMVHVITKTQVLMHAIWCLSWNDSTVAGYVGSHISPPTPAYVDICLLDTIHSSDTPKVASWCHVSLSGGWPPQLILWVHTIQGSDTSKYDVAPATEYISPAILICSIKIYSVQSSDRQKPPVWQCHFLHWVSTTSTTACAQGWPSYTPAPTGPNW